MTQLLLGSGSYLLAEWDAHRVQDISCANIVNTVNSKVDLDVILNIYFLHYIYHMEKNKRFEDNYYSRTSVFTMVYYYKEDIEEDDSQKIYYCNNNIVLSKHKYIGNNINILNGKLKPPLPPSPTIVDDKYKNIKKEKKKDKFNHYNMNLRNLVSSKR